MDQNVIGTVDDGIDPLFFNFLDVGNAVASPDDTDNFKWVDDFITSTELGEAPLSPMGSASPTPPPPTQQNAAAPSAASQQSQSQMTGTPTLGSVIMAMGQPTQQQQPQLQQAQQQKPALALATASQTQLLHGQATILSNNLGGQPLGSNFILKTSSGTPIHLAQTAVTQSTATINAASQQFLAAAPALISRSITPSQSSSPLLSRSLTPSQTLSAAATATRPSSVGQPQVLQIHQSQQLNQQVPLSNFVAANQSGLQGHAVLTAQGSNIVHTQNALIQNPNVVNVNVAHVLPNQLPQLQGTIVQTPQGKILIHSPANSQPLGQQLNLSTLSNLGQPVQVAGGQPVQMAGGHPMQMAGGQTVQMASGQAVQMAPSVGLGNVTLANSSGVGQAQPSFNLINLGGSQGQILVQRMPTQTPTSTLPATPTQGPFLLRTVNGQQQLLQQQPTLQPNTTVSLTTAQLPQQIVGTGGATQNIPLQQLLAGGAGQPLRLVGQPVTAATPQQATTTTANNNVVLQSLVAAGNQVRLVSQQTPAQKKKGLLSKGTEAKRQTRPASKPGTVTLNLGGQNLSLQQFQSLQLTAAQQQQVLLQQQLTTTAAATTTTAVQQTVVQASSQQLTVTGSGKKSKSKSFSSTASSSVAAAATVSVNTDTNSAASSDSGAVVPDNILSVALMSSGILEDEGILTLMNGGDASDVAATQADTPTTTPPPAPVSTPAPIPTSTSKSKKKKKKKEVEVSANIGQPVVYSNTSTITLTTASSTTVTTTISQAAVASVTQAEGQFSTATHMTMGTQSAVMSSVPQPTIGMPAVALTSPVVVSGASGTATLSQGATPVRGKHGGRALPTLQSLSETDRETLRQIQVSLAKLKEKASPSEEETRLMQQLDASRKRILAQAHTRTMAAIKQQQMQMQQQSGQAGQVTLQAGDQPAQVGQPQLKLDVKPVVGTASTPLVQIQPKSNAPKLRLVSPKVEPPVIPDVKPVIMASAVHNNTNNILTSQSNVIMTMSTPASGGQREGGQPQVLRIQIGGGHKPPAVGLPSVAAAATVSAAATTTSQSLVVHTPQKVVMAATVPTSSSTVMTAAPTPSQGAPSVARPVQIKIATQVMTLQLTPQQQEKLELHLSRMTLEQQQAFLHMQHHILTKLQLRADSQVSAQPAALQLTPSNVQGAAAVMPTVVAAVSATGDSAAKTLQIRANAANLTTSTTVQSQIPVTVQAADESQSSADASQNQKSAAAATVTPRARIEIPKASLIHSQLCKDQEHAMSADVVTPFKDNREACRRLLRFHVCQHHGPAQDDFDQFDEEYERVSEELVEKKNAMFSQYRRLMMEDSMRTYATSEQVLINRIWCNEMNLLIRAEKQQNETNPETFVPMPMSYLEKDLTEKDDSEDEVPDLGEASQEEDEPSDREDLSEEAEREEEATDLYPPDGASSYVEEETEPQDQPYYLSLVDGVAGVVGDEQDEQHQFAPLDHDSVEHNGSSFHESFEASSPPGWRRESDPLGVMSSVLDVIDSPRREQEDEEVREEEASPPSSPPPCPPPKLVKLVIRCDPGKKSFTSNIVEQQASESSRRRRLRSRSQSGDKEREKRGRKEARREARREPVSEEVEYIDVDNSRYNRSVSVKLERLPDKPSHDLGHGTGDRAPPADAGRDRAQDRKNRDGSKSVRKKGSGKHRGDGDRDRRKKRRHKAEAGCEEGRYGKVRRHPSGASDEGCGDRVEDRLGHGGGGHSRPAVARRKSPVREFYVGSAMESLDHFDSDDDGQEYVADLDMGGGQGGGPLSLDLRHSDNSGSAISRLVCSSPIPTASPHHPHRHQGLPYLDLVEPHSTEPPGRRGEVVDLDEYIPESPVEGPGMRRPPFPAQIPHSLMATDRMFDTSPSHGELESSFDLETLDPQRRMVNPQVQSAIDSILNGSGASDVDLDHLRPRQAGDDTSVEYQVGGARRGGHHDNRQSEGWDEESQPDDHNLSAAVQSILR